MTKACNCMNYVCTCGYVYGRLFYKTVIFPLFLFWKNNQLFSLFCSVLFIIFINYIISNYFHYFSLFIIYL
jgi:hypothetical protein